MSQKQQSCLDSLVLEGTISAKFASFISQKKSNYHNTQAIASAAFWASLSAFKKARKTQIPLLLEKNNALYELHPNGEKKFIKHLEKLNLILPKKFILK